jgi:TRAP-type mannitol/chloroaromatic compound transport system permease small subunit
MLVRQASGTRGPRPPKGEEGMRAIAITIRLISGINRAVGNVFAWLSLGIVLICFTVVVQRYVLSTSHVWMQDLYVWLNGAMFTTVAGFALLRGDHVRVDIFYRPARTKTKAAIDLAGVLCFLLPYCFVVYSYGIVSVARSWRFMEASPNQGGMPGYFVLKSFILLFAVLLALQGIAMALRSILVLRHSEHLLPAALRYENEAGAHG